MKDMYLKGRLSVDIGEMRNRRGRGVFADLIVINIEWWLRIEIIESN